MGRSRRRHWHQLAASVALRSRLLRQRRGVVDAYAAGQVVTVWAEGDSAVAAGEGIRKSWAIALTARLVRTACGPSAFSRCELETLARGGPAVSEWTRACPPGRNDLARPLSLNSRSRMRRAAPFDIPAPGRMICSQISASVLVDATDTGNPVLGTILPKRTLQRAGRHRH